MTTFRANDNARSPDACVYELALGLLECASLADVVERAPALLTRALNVTRVELKLDGARAPEQQTLMSLPLRHQGHTLGVVLIEARPDDVWDADRHTAALRQIALLAAAVASHSTSVAEFERARGAAAELRNDMIATLSHDMRTPLASIKGYASALLLEEAEWDVATRDEFLRAIEAESDHLNGLITDILDSAAIEAGALPVDLEPVLLPRIVRRVVERFSHRNAIHRFVVQLPNDLPIVEADEQRIEQVLANLIDNAVKYSPDGGVVVARGELRPDSVLMQVIDQGIGIAPEDVAKLFERFFRADAGGSRIVAGTGLGLPISDAIVRAHGGRIRAESALGRGATFSFTLPRAPRLELALAADE